jgi:hypothetical protein
MNRLTKSIKRKTKRKVRSLLEKVEVSGKFDWEMCIIIVRHHYDVNELTNHFIKKNKEKLRTVLRSVLP